MDLVNVVHNAWDVGNKIDLSGIGYGKIHWGNHKDIIKEPFDYYKFLSGFVATLGITRILEIGTHWGGSAVSMARGCAFNKRQDATRIFTMDVTDESDKWLPFQPESRLIHKYVGDANHQSAVRSAFKFFQPDCKLDLLFIDSDHSFMPSIIQYAVYSAIFSPKFVILDDVNLNDEMRDLWTILKKNIPKRNHVVANEIISEVRGHDSGFGIISLSE